MTSNQGRDLEPVLRDITWADIGDMATVIWREVSIHPSEATCECPAVEAVARLYELGYRVVREES